MNIAKKVAVSMKNFVVAHKTGFALTTGALIGLQINRSEVRSHDTFLKEHNLYEAFHTATE